MVMKSERVLIYGAAGKIETVFDYPAGAGAAVGADADY